MIIKAAKLDRDEEPALYARWRKTKDRRIKDQFVLSVMGLIVREAKKHLRSIPLEDRINAGVVGACKAFDRFDPSRGLRFNTYALFWVLGEITALDRSTPLVSGITKRYDKSGEKLNAARLRVQTTSIEQLEESGIELEIAAEDPEEALDNASELEKLAALIDKADFTEDERWVIRARWLTARGEPKSFRKLGAARGMSAEWVRKLEVRAFEKIRELKS